MNLLDFHQSFDKKILDLMEAERLDYRDVWVGAQIKPIPCALPAEPYRMPDNTLVLITGSPFFWGQRLDFQQGYDNPQGFFGTCTHTSIANICTIAGVTINGRAVTEPDVVKYAIDNKLSNDAKEDGLGGATTIGGQLRILEHFQLPSHCEFNTTAKCERVAECIEGGHGVICGLNSGILQDREWKNKGVANHSVCMTGTVRNMHTRELLGFYLCDSSAQVPHGGMIFVPLAKMRACYEVMEESFIVVTNSRIR